MEFKKITYDDLDTIKKYTLKADTKNCEFAPANVCFWNEGEDIRYTIYDDVLLYRSINKAEGSVIAHYSPLELPEDPERFINDIEEDARQTGEKMMISNISDEMVHRLGSDMVGQLEFGYDRSFSDYIYLTESLITLSGSKLHGKKNHLNKFLKTYDFTYERIGRENIEECRQMKNEWAALKGEDDDEFREELHVIDRAFDAYDIFDFRGGLIRIDGKVVAFTFGEPVSRDTFVTHFEKAYEDIPGLYQAINQQFAANELAGFTYVNREDDVGIEGLRRAKLSYRPVMMCDKYYAVKTL
ncbi:MAG: DUF2156 domain-containing protein [Butyrivibrio sp.]